MIRVDCLTAPLQVVIPACATVPSAATLSRRDAPAAIALTIVNPPGTPPFPANTQQTLGLVIPGTTPRGIYRLRIASACGCYETDVFVDTCQPPAHQAIHTPTFPPTTAPECCLPEGERALTGTGVIIEPTRMLLAPYPAGIIGKAFIARDTSGHQIAAGIVAIDGAWAVFPGVFPGNNIYLEITSP